MKMKKNASSDRIIFLALFHRYFYFLILLVLLKLIPKSKKEYVLILGVFLLLYAAYGFVGYLFRWKHIYCSYQNANHLKMTPDRINWNMVRKSDCIGVPALFAIMGAACIAVAFV